MDCQISHPQSIRLKVEGFEPVKRKNTSCFWRVCEIIGKERPGSRKMDGGAKGKGGFPGRNINNKLI